MAKGLVAAAAGIAAALALGGAALADGTFSSSDPLLNRIWQASVRTADDMLAPGGQTVDAKGRPCATPAGTAAILDGTVRDRCPYIGDESVIDAVFDASTPHLDVQQAMLRWFAAHQHGDGAIPSSPLNDWWMVLFDYNGYWLEALHRYVLYSGDVPFARELWPNVTRLVDGWYRSHQLTNGLLLNDLGFYDYAFVHRRGNVVAYYNAEAVVAIRDAADLATWTGNAPAAQRWSRLANQIAAASAALWDPAAGAFGDTLTDRTTHPQDGNAFAVLAGIGTEPQRADALDYLWRHDSRPYGNTIVDTDAWDNAAWGWQASERCYPFISYYEVVARFAAGDDLRALDLIRREWGYMLANGPQSTMWETIGPFGGRPTDQWPSWDAGWSAGAAAALTEWVLGVQPTSPGFSTFTVTPHTGDLTSASGTVPTPRGDIQVAWTLAPDGSPSVTVTAPPGTRWVDAPKPSRRHE